MAVGALAGIAIGTVGGMAIIGAQNRGCHADTCGLAYLAVPLFTAGGFVAGTNTGSFWHAERWERVELQR